MDYNFRDIEQKWQKRWVENGTYRVVEDKTKKKFYVLNMFPYPSGAGLHVGHPLGYIASDIYARYKRQQGFNVLIARNWIRSASVSIGTERYALVTPSITSGHNGPSNVCSRAISAHRLIRLSQLSSSLSTSN